MERLAREVMFLMFAGTDTTAATMCRAVQHLAQHPQWMDMLWEDQQRLIAEFGEEIDRKVRALVAACMCTRSCEERTRPDCRIPSTPPHHTYLAMILQADYTSMSNVHRDFEHGARLYKAVGPQQSQQRITGHEHLVLLSSYRKSADQ